MKKTLCIARYDEDVKWWLHKIDPAIRIYIYNKGPHNLAPQLSPLCQRGYQITVIRLPNVGNCVQTYTHHIVQHYDALEEQGMLIFVQGYLHHEDAIRTINTLQGNERFGELGFPWMLMPPAWDKNGRCNNYARKLWRKFFNDPFPHFRCYPVGGMWYVQPEQIKKRPKSFYQKIREFSLIDPAWIDCPHPRPPVSFGGWHEGLLPFIYGGYTYEEWCLRTHYLISSTPIFLTNGYWEKCLL